MRAGQHRSRAWRLAAGVAILALLLWRLGPAELGRALGAMPVSVLLPAAALATLLPLCHAWRWRRLLEIADQRVPLLEAIRVTVAASAANYLVPAFGWAPAKVVATRQWLGIGVRRALPTLVIEQALDLAVLASCALVGFWQIRPTVVVPITLVSFRTRSVLGMLVLAGVAGAGLAAALSARVRKFGLEVVTVGYGVLRETWRDPVVWLATVGRWGVELLVLAWLVAAARLPVDWGGLFVLLGGPGIVGALSPIPGGLGIREATGVLLARWLGWDPVVVGAVLAWQRLVTLTGLGAAGVVTSIARRIRQ
ncbi:lysylphosphatidylglycerol synthase transmembrane domain-containing protein [Thermomicrobium sp. 4228-Ro]|uniref:lysylphosphatidylglycerol synthase transmembrane domain-containing protein n=1 Tax=Thermomicrobium sp. 4228-Ro TaxID=2993937 RepID=UPI0022496DEA|nr:lysylphosphatidylglycerol synthase transmembrane domain-containing protein [Thermomicrobium sp. 4228-Ro]MCX2727427.1 lysylphosphatidylglycerol synthase transmembrane domain-containing protein [Thermomicrobium sp. 4228-Ro]